MQAPTKGPNEMPMTLARPKIDIGKHRSFGVTQTSVTLPPTRLITIDDAPPPKNRTTIRVAKFLPKAQGKKEIIRRM